MDSLSRRLSNGLAAKGLFLCALVLSLVMGSPFTHAATDQSPAELVQAGVTAYDQGDYTAALSFWQQALVHYPDTASPERALVNENLARTYGLLGNTPAAIAAWAAAAENYEQSNKPIQFGRMLTEQAQVYLTLGQYQRAAALLCGEAPAIEITDQSASAAVQCTGGAVAIAEATDDPTGQTAALGSLAETYRLIGNYEVAQALSREGLQIAEVEALPQFVAPLLNSLGNTYARLFQVADRRAEAANLLRKLDIAQRLRSQAMDHYHQAQDSFGRAITVARAQGDSLTELQSYVSQLSLYQSTAHSGAIRAVRQQIGELINTLPPSRETAYSAITLAKAYQGSQNFTCSPATDSLVVESLVEPWLQKGYDIARQIQDDRARSFALGELGHLQECRGQLADALHLTHQAQLAASDALESADSQYLWEWQMGRIYYRQGASDRALAAYEQAIATLESIRTDILTADRELQFDFRDTVEPIYRQFVELQLGDPLALAATKQLATLSPTKIDKVLGAVDALRLAELQNFFGDDCVLVSSKGAQKRLLASDPGTAVISSIVLGQRTALIASFADGNSKIAWVDNSDRLKATAREFRRSLKRFRVLAAYDNQYAQALYKQLIEPFEDELTAANINTLVFVQDGFLRNIPMAALHDGQNYLIQRYAIATTPSLGLTAASTGRARDLQVLAVGLSKATVTERGQAFSALNFVPSELASISKQLPDSTILLNEDFTVARLTAALQESQYAVLHLATHGQFSTIPEDTFVVTGTGDSEVSGELTFGQLERLLRESSPATEPLDLITLTACETATGDDRATLGLAGVAIRAGARSAIASLWKVNDETAAQLVDSFYEKLKDPSLSKAQSLQAAQVAAIEANAAGANPGYWAPLILVGNWQ